jgi:hypothetical protein
MVKNTLLLLAIMLFIGGIVLLGVGIHLGASAKSVEALIRCTSLPPSMFLGSIAALLFSNDSRLK